VAETTKDAAVCYLLALARALKWCPRRGRQGGRAGAARRSRDGDGRGSWDGYKHMGGCGEKAGQGRRVGVSRLSELRRGFGAPCAGQKVGAGGARALLVTAVVVTATAISVDVITSGDVMVGTTDRAALQFGAHPT